MKVTGTRRTGGGVCQQAVCRLKVSKLCGLVFNGIHFEKYGNYCDVGFILKRIKVAIFVHQSTNQ